MYVVIDSPKPNKVRIARVASHIRCYELRALLKEFENMFEKFTLAPYPSATTSHPAKSYEENFVDFLKDLDYSSTTVTLHAFQHLAPVHLQSLSTFARLFYKLEDIVLLNAMVTEEELLDTWRCYDDEEVQILDNNKVKLIHDGETIEAEIDWSWLL